MPKRMRIWAEATVVEIVNFVSQSDNKMDSYDSDSETGVYNNYCITFTSLVKKNFLAVKNYMHY